MTPSKGEKIPGHFDLSFNILEFYVTTLSCVSVDVLKKSFPSFSLLLFSLGTRVLQNFRSNRFFFFFVIKSSEPLLIDTKYRSRRTETRDGRSKYKDWNINKKKVRKSIPIMDER